tara:strand:- start:1597 stop:2958 length:1362 start_codon:yes stop_codon:yes gene_type:complete
MNRKFYINLLLSTFSLLGITVSQVIGESKSLSAKAADKRYLFYLDNCKIERGKVKCSDFINKEDPQLENDMNYLLRSLGKKGCTLNSEYIDCGKREITNLLDNKIINRCNSNIDNKNKCLGIALASVKCEIDKRFDQRSFMNINQTWLNKNDYKAMETEANRVLRMMKIPIEYSLFDDYDSIDSKNPIKIEANKYYSKCNAKSNKDMGFIYVRLIDTLKNNYLNDIYKYYGDKNFERKKAIWKIEEKEREEKIAARKLKDELKLKRIKKKEKLVLLERCKNITSKDHCYLLGETYIDKNSYRITTNGVTIYNTRTYYDPRFDIPGQEIKTPSERYSNINKEGIDCKSREFVDRFGRREVLLLKDALPWQLEAYNVANTDKLYRMACLSGSHPKINKSSNEVFYETDDPIEQFFIDRILNKNQGDDVLDVDKKIHDLCKDSSDYAGCLKYQKDQ